MAKTLSILSSLLLSAAFVAAAESNQFSTYLSPSQVVGLKREKLTHLHFYFHDTISGKNPTAVPVAQAATTNTSATHFGEVLVMDDPLTVGPEISSLRVGSSQGIYASASQNGVGLLMVLNFVFTEGRFNGSTLSLLGHNAIFSEVREMPIVGGSGVFRFSRGYAQARTFSHLNNLDAVVEYNVYVFHY